MRTFDRLRSGSVQTVFYLVIGTVLLSLGSCTRRSPEIFLSSGIANGYYSRLGQQIGSVSQETVNLKLNHLSSEGSRQNLERLLNRQTDFALVQLDVVSEAMRQGKVQAVATLADEPIHVIAHKEAKVRSLSDLEGKRVNLGSQGSGIRFTAEAVVKVLSLNVRSDDASFEQLFLKLAARQLDAAIYVGSTGASEKLRKALLDNPSLELIPMQPELINYFVTRLPGSYRSSAIAAGTYSARPAIPSQNTPTLETATVLVTRPDVNDETVGLLTWAILYNSRQFAVFYPELQTEDARSLLQRGLFYIHPGAQTVYAQNDDPRNAWLRYLENNNDLQAGLVILLGTSGIGLLLRGWRRDRSKKLGAATTKRITELKELLPHSAQQALAGIEELSQEHRFMFVEGSITTDMYEQVRQKTQTFADQCRSTLEQQRKTFVLETLLLLDDWQASLQSDPALALEKLTQIKQQYRELLLNDQVDINSYVQLMDLTLISLMTLKPNSSISSQKDLTQDRI